MSHLTSHDDYLLYRAQMYTNPQRAPLSFVIVRLSDEINQVAKSLYK